VKIVIALTAEDLRDLIAATVYATDVLLDKLENKEDYSAEDRYFINERLERLDRIADNLVHEAEKAEGLRCALCHAGDAPVDLQAPCDCEDDRYRIR